MRHLVVGERERARRPGVQQLAAELEPDLDQPGRAQGPVDVHGIADRRDAVLRDDDDAGAIPLRLLDQLAAEAVDLLQVLLQAGLFEVGAEALQVVVEVRQIAQGQRRLARGAHVHGGPRDPLARGDVGGGPPELEQREWRRAWRRARRAARAGARSGPGSCGRPPGTSAAASRSSRPRRTCCTTRTSWRR